MLKGIIILEGANATGKSTLAELLRREHGAVVLHQTYRFRQSIFLYHTAVVKKALKLSTERLVVLDRLWMSEEVYAHVYRGGTPWPHQGRMLDRTLLKAGAVTVVCTADDNLLYARYRQTRSERTDADAVKNLEVNRRYQQLFDTLPPVDRKTYLDDLIAIGARDDLVRYEVGDSIPALFQRLASLLDANRSPNHVVLNDNLSGNLHRANFCIVGDIANPKFKCPWPFYEHGNSSLWLSEQLHTLNFEEPAAVWTNAYGTPDTLSYLAKNYTQLKFIALGRHAEDRLKALNVPTHAVIRHPQHGRRFEHKGVEYRRTLAKALYTYVSEPEN